MFQVQAPPTRHQKTPDLASTSSPGLRTLRLIRAASRNIEFIDDIFVIIQIIHLKRFQLVNGKWVKSHKIVQFPFKDFDPTNYLVPRNNNKRDAKHTLLSQTQHDSAKNSPSEPTSECAAATNGDSPATVSESPDADNKTHLPQDAGDVTSKDGGSSKDTNAASEANVSVEIEDYSDVRYDLKSLAVSTCFSAARAFKYYY